MLIALLPSAAVRPAFALDQITIGGQTGSQIFFNVTLPRTFNLGITANAGSSITIDRLLVTLAKGQQTTAPVSIAIYSGLGGTGTLLASGSSAASNFTNQFNSVPITLSSTVTMTAGYYSVRMTTTDANDYLFKAQALQLTSTASSPVVLSSSLWVQDSNQTGDAGTSLVASGTVQATWSLGTNAFQFGNYRVGTTLSATTTLVNTALATSNNVTQALSATGTTSGGVASLTGLPSPYLSVGGTSNVAAGLNSAVTGPNSGTATLAFSSVSGTSATTGTTAIGTGTVAISGTGYNWANAKVSAATLAFGNVRTGSAATLQTLAVGNQTVVNATYQDLLNVSGSTNNAAVTATGFSNLAASTNGATASNVSLSANTGTAGSLASTVSLTYTSNANGVAGLSSGSATIVGGSAPSITTTGGVFDYATAVYSGSAFSFGYIHRGGAATSGTIAIGNQTITNSSYQDSLNVSASTGNPLVSASGFTGLTASAGGASRNNLVVAVGTGTAGSLNSTLALSLVSNANGVAGLSNGVASVIGSPGSITTSGTVFTGQSTWTTNGSGQWGTLASNFGTNWNWTTFDGSPGVDAGFANTDTATFGGAVTSGTATVTVTAATPSIKALTFDNASASYGLVGASGGSLALLNAGTAAATVTAASGTHSISLPVSLGSTTSWSVAAGARLGVLGIVSGSSNVTKVGAGTLVFSGSNTYAGTTTVSAGTLVVNGDQSAATGAVSVAAGATLAGTGVIGGDTTVAGTHTPGNSPGVQTVDGNLTYTAGATVVWEIIDDTLLGRGTNYDGINVTGTLSFAGATSLDLVFNLAGSGVSWSDPFWDSNHTGTNGWLVYDGATSLAGFGNLAISGTNWADGSGAMFQTARPGASFGLYQEGSDVYLTYVVAVPEPSTLILAGLGIAAAVIIRRRRG